jgi:hypothetical protein
VLFGIASTVEACGSSPRRQIQRQETETWETVNACILAGTSETGACSHCGAPWEREIELDLAMTYQTEVEVTDEMIAAFHDETLETIENGTPAQKKAINKEARPIRDRVRAARQAQHYADPPRGGHRRRRGDPTRQLAPSAAREARADGPLGITPSRSGSPLRRRQAA